MAFTELVVSERAGKVLLMCGIVGVLTLAGRLSASELHLQVAKMSVRLRHRGPDDSGTWADPGAGVALAHQRLAIVDLSDDGHQPMVSASGRYVISFNGEVYNFRSLRAELEALGHRFRGHSDTAVMLAAMEQWGLMDAVQRFNGMFAFAVWDRERRALHLIRDRLGEKPLYYGWMGRTLLFGSELKALRGHPAWKGTVDRNALALYVRHNYVPGPYCIYDGISKLPPGTVGTVLACHDEPEFTVTPYWSVRDAAERGLTNPYRGSADEAVAELDALLREAVRLRMVADVPLGAFLSGGIDSSTIVSLMQTQSSAPIQTFTIGFHESDYNEAEHAKAVAAHLGTSHTELYVRPHEAMAVVPRLPQLYDEPFSDSSQIPTFLVCELARRSVTVSLSGDGGDELFAGYERYPRSLAVWTHLHRLPRRFRTGLAEMLQVLSAETWDAISRSLRPLLPRSAVGCSIGEKIHRLAELMTATDREGVYRSIVSHAKHPASLVHGAIEPRNALTDRAQWPHVADFPHRMMALDLASYLPDDILVKVDRASMGVSLESRVPLLDHRVVEFAWRLPLSMKLREEQGKWVLRQLLYRYVPRELVERPKRGFGVPLDTWLCGPLREWADSLLDEKRLRDQGFFEPAPVRKMWEQHVTGRHPWHYHLWDILMFQAWFASTEGSIP